MPDLEEIARHHFGVTEDIRETGYVLPDGTFLDFSGRHLASGYVKRGDRFVAKRGDDYLRAQRSIDHRQLPTEILNRFRSKKHEGFGSYPMFMFMKKTGAIRVMPGAGMGVATMPTFEALDAFLAGWKRAYQDDSVIVDVLEVDDHSKAGVRTKKTGEIQDPTLDKLAEFIEAGLESKNWQMGNIRWKKGPKDWSPSGYVPGMPIWPKFVDAYLEAAIWSSDDQSGEPLDKRFDIDDFAQEAVNKAVRDCNEFIEKNKVILEKHGNPAHHGYNFWMSRNGHGVGFFDRGYGDDGDLLQEAAEEYGEEQIIVGGDGKLRFF
jgi:hypothetical protein